MQFGCCVPGGSFMPQGEGEVPQSAEEILLKGMQTILNAGYDYAEISAGFVSRLTEVEISHLEGLNQSGRLHISRCNSFIPPALYIWDGANETALYEYVKRVLTACARMGIEKMVFGSGAARRLPAGMDIETGHQGIIKFLHRCNAYAEKCRVEIVLEPLNRSECNVLTTVRECAAVVRKANCSHIRLLADAFHVYMEKEALSVIGENADIITHIHIAEPPNRVYPGRDGGEYLRAFAAALKAADYNGSVSVECGFNRFEPEIKAAYPFVKEIFR